MNEKRYVFGYGSIINPGSAAKDIDPRYFERWVTLTGYERIFDAAVDGFLALNLRPAPHKSVEGVLFATNEASWDAFIQREKGYSPTDITKSLTENVDGQVFAFLMPNYQHHNLTIMQSYYELCVSAIPVSLRTTWIAETIIENPITSVK